MKSSYALAGVIFCCKSGIISGMMSAQVQQLPVQQVPVQQIGQVVQGVVRVMQSAEQLDQFMQYLLPVLLQKTEVAQGCVNTEVLSLSEQNAVGALGRERLQIWDEQGSKINPSEVDDYFVTALASNGQKFLAGTTEGAILEVDPVHRQSQNVGTIVKTKVLAITKSLTGMVAVSSNDNVVEVRYGDDAFTLKFDYPITLMGNDGKTSFVFGNKNRKAVTIFKSNASEVRKIPALPTALVLDQRGRLYVGSESGRIFILEGQGEQATWRSFETGKQPIKFLAVYDDIIMVAHEQSGMLHGFNLKENPLYSLMLSPQPVRQIATNGRGSIACITQSGKVRRWTILSTLAEAFTPLTADQKVLLCHLMNFAQKYGYSEKEFQVACPRFQGQLHDIPKVLRDKLKRDYPRTPSAARLAGKGSAFLDQNESSTWRGKITCYLRSIQRFAQENTQLTAGVVSVIVYCILFKRPAIKKASGGFADWVRNLFGRSSKTSPLFFWCS